MKTTSSTHFADKQFIQNLEVHCACITVCRVYVPPNTNRITDLPEAHCSTFVIETLKSVRNQEINSVRGTKKQPSIIPTLLASILLTLWLLFVASVFFVYFLLRIWDYTATRTLSSMLLLIRIYRWFQ